MPAPVAVAPAAPAVAARVAVLTASDRASSGAYEVPGGGWEGGEGGLEKFFCFYVGGERFNRL